MPSSLRFPVGLKSNELCPVYFLVVVLSVSFLIGAGTSVKTQPPALPPAFSKPLYVRQAPIKCTGLACDPVSHKIYVSLPSSFGPDGNSIATLDPVTGALGKPIFVGSEPAGMAASADGRYLYIILEGARSICRFNLHTLKVDQEFSCNIGIPTLICVCPRDSLRIVVARRGTAANSLPENVGLFDNGVESPRNTRLQDWGSTLAFNADGTRVYAYDGSQFHFFYRWDVGSAGWTSRGDRTMNVLDSANLKMVFANGLIYATNGQVFDPETLQTKGRFPDAGGDIVVNQKAGRVLFFRRKDEGCLITAYDPQKYLLAGQSVIPKVDGELDSAQMCGDGYVFRCGGKVVVLSSTPGLIEACKSRDWSQASSLLLTKQNVNCVDEVGATALIWVAAEGQLSLCKTLLDRGADVGIKDGRRNAALHYAVLSGNIALVDLLLRSGADVNDSGMLGSPIKIATDMGRDDLVRLLREAGGK